MKKIYIAYDNVMNYLVIRDMERGEDDTAVINWDFDDDEMEWMHNCYKDPVNNGDIIKACACCAIEWESFEDIKARMNSIRELYW